jgi:Protein of unknown function (DUF4244)
VALIHTARDPELSADRVESRASCRDRRDPAGAIGQIVRTDRLSEPGGPMIDKVRRRFGGDDGMTTAEYAVGTVAACGFAGTLIQLLGSDWVQDLLKSVIDNAFDFIF